jgi:hypothetical protein
MANWAKIKDDFAVDQLIGLYVKVNKDTPVYAYIDGYGNGVLWVGWAVKAGEIAGRLDSWVDGSAFVKYGASDYIDGLYFMMEGTQYTNNKPYYIKFEPGLLDWGYTRSQLDAIRKSKMKFYEKWFDELENKLRDIYNAAKQDADNKVEAIKTGMVKAGKIAIGVGVVFVVWKAWDSFFKYDYLLKQGAKYLKR